MGTQGTVLVSSALYGQNDEASHGALLSKKYEVSSRLDLTFIFFLFKGWGICLKQAICGERS